jgi:hypothetical protein
MTSSYYILISTKQKRLTIIVFRETTILYNRQSSNLNYNILKIIVNLKK